MFYNILEYISIITTVLLIINFTNNILKFLQQNHYHFNGVYKSLRFFYIQDKINYILIVFIPFIFYLKEWYVCLGYILLSIGLLLYKYNKKDIISLKYTKRIRRLYFLIIVIQTTVGTLLSLVTSFYIVTSVLIICLLIAPVITTLCFLIMIPIEYLIYKGFEKKAKLKLKSINPIVIGITGSYGKTSTKNYLYELIKLNYMTLKTPKSYNTLNGICLTINNDLESFDEVFICEMGASHLGDIEKLCNFVKPKFGIVTEVGRQHLETFKSVNNIIVEKMKLIESLPVDGVGFVNIDNKYIKDYKIKNVCKIVTFGLDKNADIYADEINYNKNGLCFKVHSQDNIINVKTKLLGKHQIYNILCSIAMALELNVEIDIIEKQISLLEPVKNRLELKFDGNITIIDDAFNSNEVGFINAIEVLSFFPGKKVLITPGIVEAGVLEEEINYNLASEIAKICDRVLMIKTKASLAIAKGLSDIGYQKYEFVENFQTAFNKAKEIGNVILIENDVNDLYKI